MADIPTSDGLSNGRPEALVVCFGEMLINFVPSVSGVSLAEAPDFEKASCTSKVPSGRDDWSSETGMKTGRRRSSDLDDGAVTTSYLEKPTSWLKKNEDWSSETVYDYEDSI